MGRRKINTHSASYIYPYDHHRDISDDKCEGIRKRGITRVELTADIQPGDVDTKNHFNFEYENFVSLNFLDEEKRDWIDKVIPDMETHVSVCNGKRPFWMNTTFLYMSTFCFMGWPFKLLFYMSTEKTSYEFKKEFFVNVQNLPGPDDNCGDTNAPVIHGDSNAPVICGDNNAPVTVINYNIVNNAPMNSGLQQQPTDNGLPYPSKDSGLSNAQPINPGMVSTDNNLGWQKPSMEPQQEKITQKRILLHLLQIVEMNRKKLSHLLHGVE